MAQGSYQQVPQDLFYQASLWSLHHVFSLHTGLPNIFGNASMPPWKEVKTAEDKAYSPNMQTQKIKVHLHHSAFFLAEQNYF